MIYTFTMSDFDKEAAREMLKYLRERCPGGGKLRYGPRALKIQIELFDDYFTIAQQKMIIARCEEIHKQTQELLLKAVDLP